MAITKANRSVKNKQLVHGMPGSSTLSSNQQSVKPEDNTASNQKLRIKPRKLIRFAQAKGKIVAKVEFSAAPDHYDFGIYFRDKTGFNFTIASGFTLKTEYSNWKSGEQRIKRVWPLFRSHT